MRYASVRAHSRRGHQVRAHSRRTNGMAIADALASDLDRIYEERDTQGPQRGIVGADLNCPHPAWYPIRRILLDTPYEESPILAYCCTDCAATRPVEDRKVTEMSCNPKSRECFVGSHRKCNGEVPHESSPSTPCECACHARDRELVAA